MKRHIPGLLMAAACGAIAGYLIYLWRGNILAPYICGTAALFLRFYRIRRKDSGTR